jgi:hypothetical protein
MRVKPRTDNTFFMLLNDVGLADFGPSHMPPMHSRSSTGSSPSKAGARSSTLGEHAFTPVNTCEARKRDGAEARGFAQ